MGAPEPGPDGGGSARRGAVSGPRCKARRDTLWRWVTNLWLAATKASGSRILRVLVSHTVHDRLTLRLDADDHLGSS